MGWGEPSDNIRPSLPLAGVVCYIASASPLSLWNGAGFSILNMPLSQIACSWLGCLSPSGKRWLQARETRRRTLLRAAFPVVWIWGCVDINYMRRDVELRNHIDTSWPRHPFP
jgi:hypothetical protein